MSFPSRAVVNPRVYAYSDSHEQYRGLLKIGYTTLKVEERVKQQYPTLHLENQHTRYI